MGRKGLARRLARYVTACPTGCLANTRTSLGAPPALDGGERSIEANNPGAEMRRGNEEMCSNDELQ